MLLALLDVPAVVQSRVKGVLATYLMVVQMCQPCVPQAQLELSCALGAAAVAVYEEGDRRRKPVPPSLPRESGTWGLRLCNALVLDHQVRVRPLRIKRLLKRVHVYLSPIRV